MMSHYTKAVKKNFEKNIRDCVIRPLMRQRESGELCDAVIILNGHHFCAHKAILSIWSPYFLSMFTCDMREKLSREIDLSESLVLDNDAVLKGILDYMYTGSLVLSTETIEDILRIADFFLMDDIKDYCRQFYIEFGNLDLRNCLHMRFLAETHNLPAVMNTCQKIIEARFHDYIIHHDDILELPPLCFARILEDPKVIQHSPYSEVNNLIQRWIDSDPVTRRPYIGGLIETVKLWIYDSQYTSSYLACRGLGRSVNVAHGMTCSCPDMNEENMNKPTAEKMSLSYNMGKMHDVLFGIVCNQGGTSKRN